MAFDKEHMESGQYKWNNDPDLNVFSGGPTRRLFNRYDGDQVLFIINCYASLSENFSIEEGKEIEKEIINHLPLDAKSEISVINWIKSLNLVREKNPEV